MSSELLPKGDKMNIAEIISPIASLVSENKTTIMTAVGVGGLIFSGVHAAVKSTPRALQIIDNEEAYRANQEENFGIPYEPLTLFDKIKLTWNIYALDVIIAILSSLDIFLAHHMDMQAVAALTAACQMYQTKYLDLQKASKEVLSEQQIQKIEDKVAEQSKNEITKADIKKANKHRQPHQNQLYKDAYSTQVFWASPDQVKDALYDLNTYFTNYSYATVDDWHSCLRSHDIAIDDGDADRKIGWNIYNIMPKINGIRKLEIIPSTQSSVTNPLEAMTVIRFSDEPTWEPWKNS